MAVSAAVVMLAASCGGPADKPTPEPPASSGVTPDESAAPSITKDELRRGLRQIIAAGTGHSLAVVAQPPDDASLQWVLPTVSGQWDFIQHASSTVVTSEDAEVGELTLTTIVTGKTAHVQALFDGSLFAPDCWMSPDQQASWIPAAVAPLSAAHVLGSEGAHGENVTMPLTAVLGALGFQKVANATRSDLKGVRVDAVVRFSGDAVSGWGVSDEAIAAALDSSTSDSTKQAVQLFEAAAGARWEVSIQDLQEPVDIHQPPTSRILDTEHQQCRG